MQWAHLLVHQNYHFNIARLKFQESKCSHTTPSLHFLHWLLVTQRAYFEILLTTFKAIHGPLHNSDLIISDTKSHKISIVYVQTTVYVSTSQRQIAINIRRRFFSVAAPKLWKKLPKSIRDCTCLVPLNFL